MTSKHGRLSILVVTLTLSACTLGRRSAIERRHPAAARHPTRARDRAAFGGRGIADSDARGVSQPRSQLR